MTHTKNASCTEIRDSHYKLRFKLYVLRSNFVTKQWRPSRTVTGAFTYQPVRVIRITPKELFSCCCYFPLPIGTQWLTSTLSLSLSYYTLTLYFACLYKVTKWLERLPAKQKGAHIEAYVYLRVWKRTDIKKK